MKSLDVCFSPELFGSYSGQSGIVVIVDILRATTAFCAAFDSGVNSIVPVADLERLEELGKSGYLTAGERDGMQVAFTDFGNSPIVFVHTDLKGKDLAYSTTNGTRAIQMAGSGEIVIAAFSNLDAVAGYLLHSPNNILILCAGWKGTFSLEDSVFAGALSEKLLESGKYQVNSDSVSTALLLWNKAKTGLKAFCSQGEHYKRLEKLGLNDDLDYCFQLNTSGSLPLWKNGRLENYYR